MPERNGNWGLGVKRQAMFSASAVTPLPMA
jgi:hypothetical protein